MTEPILSIRDAVKRYGDVAALDRVTLDVAEGEFLTLLGPSGSGKTTLLTAIAGFTRLTEGRIALRGRDISALPPEKRGFGMVFQGYALFPSMSVAQNIGFPLKVRGMNKADIAARVAECLDLVQMTAFADRMPAQLSGGQQQRIALARALSFKPQVLLLDEPLSALDKKLRADLQWELKALHERLGVTFIYVTHDQDEALSMSDRIVILAGGRIQQEGAPEGLYARPRTAFVANFLGKSNFLDVTVTGHADGAAICAAGDETLEIAADAPPPVGAAMQVALRPERIALGPAGGAGVAGTVRQASYLGERVQVIVDTPSCGELLVSRPTWKAEIHPDPGLPVTLSWDRDACVFLTAD
jgi:putative spermidine/putrescine transport system ATP-binding protein